MLFPIDPNTRRCRVFELLNATFLEFLSRSIDSTPREFSSALFNLGDDDPCWDNRATRLKFLSVLGKLPRSLLARQRFYELVEQSQNLANFFNNDTVVIPEIENNDLKNALQDLTSHLYTNTKDLVKTREEANDSINEHYQDFIRRNGTLCPFCGTELLSQNRDSVAVGDQWRADYDHLLCKSDYSLFGVHPDNFIPTCRTCNSKAKGTRKLLKDANGQRRKAFYPYAEGNSCMEFISITPRFAEIDEYRESTGDFALVTLEINYQNCNETMLQKIDVWDEVYEVPSRVRKNLSDNFLYRLMSDLTPNQGDFDDFSGQLTRKANREPSDIKSSEWRFWWFKLYQSLNSNEVLKRTAWEGLEWKVERLENDKTKLETVFGI